MEYLWCLILIYLRLFKMLKINGYLLLEKKHNIQLFYLLEINQIYKLKSIKNKLNNLLRLIICLIFKLQSKKVKMLIKHLSN